MAASKFRPCNAKENTKRDHYFPIQGLILFFYMPFPHPHSGLTKAKQLWQGKKEPREAKAILNLWCVWWELRFIRWKGDSYNKRPEQMQFARRSRKGRLSLSVDCSWSCKTVAPLTHALDCAKSDQWRGDQHDFGKNSVIHIQAVGMIMHR